MTVFEGNSETQTINLGWESLTNIVGKISKDIINSYSIRLSWNTPNSIPEGSNIKYYINYLGKIFITSNSSYILPVNYGNYVVDEVTGLKTVEEVCLTIETRYYFNDNSYSQGQIQSFCFCPPADLYCKKRIESIQNNSFSSQNNSNSNSVNSVFNKNNISTKRRYASAVTNINGSSGFNFNRCSSINYWESQRFRLALAKNDCYKKENVIILPNQDQN